MTVPNDTERSGGRCGRSRPQHGEGGDSTRFKFGGRGPGRGGGRGQSSGFGHGHGHGHGHGKGPWSRARRGDVRAAILLALADEPMHGYQIMQRLEERSGGAWRPSPGSVYPTLQLLEDQGLIKGEEAEGRRVFSLTEAGVEEARVLKERLGDSPWGAEGGEQDPRFALRQAVFQLGAAVKQVGTAGSADDVQKALAILREARKSMYALLADAE
ncbi:MAG: PadR family transcriptional regulator [Thermoleophilia bacterium]|nr:PadR family transcriptional regulator [Thermoleophilia bacterium]